MTTVLFPVPLDPSRDDAFSLALDIARSLRAVIRVLFVADRDGIRRREAGAPPGAIRMAREAEEEIARRESSAGAEIVSGLCRKCRDAGVGFAADIRIGIPAEEIEKAAARSDLLVAGLASQFLFDRQDAPGKMVVSFMKKRILPAVLAASPYRPVRTAVVGASGAVPSTRAIGAMARLGLWKEDCRLILAAVDDSRDEGSRRLEEGRKILEESGYPPWEEKVLPGPKARTFLEFCDGADADAVVLGGWGQHHWDEILGHSITGNCLSMRRYHLFLYM
ncbi:MAG TPA: universal stress protein [Candidatus Aquicultoraceae bacterium]|nr:universal stress protein [Candidatus Aquicultoraceae bacterium]